MLGTNSFWVLIIYHNRDSKTSIVKFTDTKLVKILLVEKKECFFAKEKYLLHFFVT